MATAGVRMMILIPLDLAEWLQPYIDKRQATALIVRLLREEAAK